MKCLMYAIVLALGVFLLPGCHSRPHSRADLVGNYQLHIGNGNCSGRGIQRSVLVLRPDGKSEQRDTFSDGGEFVTKGTWSWDGGDDISINKLRVTSALEIDKNASPAFVSLIVDWSTPPNILLNPDDDCFFTQQE